MYFHIFHVMIVDSLMKTLHCLQANRDQVYVLPLRILSTFELLFSWHVGSRRQADFVFAMCDRNIVLLTQTWEQLQNTPCYCSGFYFAHFSIEQGMRSNKLT